MLEQLKLAVVLQSFEVLVELMLPLLLFMSVLIGTLGVADLTGTRAGLVSAFITTGGCNAGCSLVACG